MKIEQELEAKKAEMREEEKEEEKKKQRSPKVKKVSGIDDSMSSLSLTLSLFHSFCFCCHVLTISKASDWFKIVVIGDYKHLKYRVVSMRGECEQVSDFKGAVKEKERRKVETSELRERE